MILALLLAASLVPKDQFFIISSIDAAKSQLVLKRPTETTALATLTPSTEIRGEHGEKLGVTDLRSGDTVYAVVKDENGVLVLVSVRRGPMTVEELHRRYPL
ncbi:MAG TPA: hypothetical protein VL284_17440 [Thermoanaerobaculia bacterium]|nr:hypothetical protein [Thermoanaerobaculia bacterium]